MLPLEKAISYHLTHIRTSSDLASPIWSRFRYCYVVKFKNGKSKGDETTTVSRRSSKLSYYNVTEAEIYDLMNLFKV